MSSTTDNYQYKLRFNVSSRPDNSDGPNPESKLTGDQGIDLKLYSNMINRGMIGANTLVNTAILQLRTSNNNNYL